MPEFETMFAQANSKNIEYEGKTLCQIDSFAVGQVEHLKLVFEKADVNQRRQGVSLETDGMITIGGTEARHVHLWYDTAPQEVKIKVQSSSGVLRVYNVYQSTKNPDIHAKSPILSFTNGAAMYFETLPNGRRYFCNDGRPDDNFTDLVFRLERSG